MNTRVDRIVVRDGHARGLEIRGQGVVEVDAVISTVSGMLTFGSLLDDADSPPRLKRMANEAKLSHSAFSVQLGLRNKIDAPSHSHCFLPPMEQQSDVFTPCDGGVRWLVYDAPTVTLPELAPAGGSVIEMYPPVRRDFPIEEWSEEKKEAVLERAVEALSRVHTLDIAVKRMVSPKDFRNNLNLYRGAVYGLSPQVAPWNHFPHRTPINGLYQTGQTTYPGYSVGRAPYPVSLQRKHSSGHMGCPSCETPALAVVCRLWSVVYARVRQLSCSGRRSTVMAGYLSIEKCRGGWYNGAFIEAMIPIRPIVIARQEPRSWPVVRGPSSVVRSRRVTHDHQTRLARPGFRGFRGGGCLSSSARPHCDPGRQHLVFAADAEHQPHPFRQRLLGQN